MVGSNYAISIVRAPVLTTSVVHVMQRDHVVKHVWLLNRLRLEIRCALWPVVMCVCVLGGTVGMTPRGD